MPQKKEEMQMYHTMHKGKGTIALVLGLLILANTYWTIVTWDYFIGIILVIAGLAKLLMKK